MEDNTTICEICSQAITARDESEHDDWCTECLKRFGWTEKLKKIIGHKKHKSTKEKD